MVFTTKAAIALAASASLLSAKDIVQFDLQRHRGSLNAKSVVSKDTASELSFELINQQIFFAVEVSIGTPVQKPVTLVIDTGSADMWINGAQVCSPGTYSNSTGASSKKKRYTKSVLEGFELTATYPSTYFDDVSTYFLGPEPTGTTTAAPAPAPTGVDCSEFGAFNPDLSSSWKEVDLGTSFSIMYVDGSAAKGVYGSDSLSINGVSVPNAIFAVSNTSNLNQGVLGISFPRDESLFFTHPNASAYNNLPQTLKNDGLISKVSYTLFLNSLCDKSGSLLFGAINPDWYIGELNTIPLVNIHPSTGSTPHEFDVTVNGVGLADYPALGDRKTVTTTKFPGVLDSGTTLMQLPPDLAFGLADELNFVWNDDFGYFVGACPSHDQLKTSSVVFNFGGINYYTPLTNFIYTTSSPQVCSFVAAPFASYGSYTDENDYSVLNNFAILGDVLLSSMVVVFDLESYEVSLGVANYEGFASGTSEAQEIISTVPGAKKAPGYSNTWTTWEYITHYSGDESDGIFTNKGEVNPWLSTASFGCGFDPTPVTTSSFPANITVATSSLVSSATGTSANATVVTSSAASTKSISSGSSSAASTTSISSGSSFAASTTSISSGSSSAASTTSISSGSSSAASATSVSSATAAAISVSTATVSDETTTLVTITSCKDHACKTTTSQALVSVATLTIEGTVTQYTTYCPISGLSSTSANIVFSSAVSNTSSSNIPSSIVTSTIGTSSSSGSAASSAVSSAVLQTSSVTAPANTTVSAVSSVNGVAKQISGSFMAFAAGLAAVL